MKHPMLTKFNYEQLGEIIAEANTLRDGLFRSALRLYRENRANRNQLNEIWKAFDADPRKVTPAVLREAIGRRVIRRR